MPAKTFLLPLLVLSGVFINATFYIDHQAVTSDASTYLHSAYNIRHFETFSEATTDDESSVLPTSYREPAYPLLLSAGILIHPELTDLKTNQFFETETTVNSNVPSLQYIHVALLVLCAALSGLLAWDLTKEKGLSIAVMIPVGFSPRLLDGVHNFLTELMTATLIALLGLLLLRTCRKNSYRYAALSGLTLACLTLTKATFMYLWIFVAGVFVISVVLKKTNLKTVKISLLLFLIAYHIPVGLWSLRNYHHFGTFRITQRGGVVLQIRAEYDQMNVTEYFASFLYWTPSKLSQNLLSHWIDEKDYQRLSRDNPEGFYRQGRLKRTQLYRELKDEQRADRILTKKAFSQIVANPLKHLATSIPFAWQGSFFEADLPKLEIINYRVLVGPALSLFLTLAFLVSCVKRRIDLLMVYLPAAYLLFFNIFVTHNIPRYNEPNIPMMWVAGFFLLWHFRFKHSSPKLKSALG